MCSLSVSLRERMTARNKDRQRAFQPDTPLSIASLALWHDRIVIPPRSANTVQRTGERCAASAASCDTSRM
ncbi:hypothetical protein K491DRAFT_778795 [Lophiostoma macrostomum CBS 122681]|uniref:Uncharacterized protein n=1 Tax=Lophiostoma macrostomum CBS 122681 TaxID=1314788 RepID=A0A6A6T9V3_9PLEO|nr:hypothetical protein K491DRAFT_778795 [Lophiostoma macrostomum CBS 122681]